MRCPKCSTETPPTALRCGGCKLLTPRGRAEAQAKLEEQDEEREAQIESRRRKARRKRKKGEAVRVSPGLATLISILTVLVCGGGMYVILTLLASKPPTPGSAEYVIQTLSALPSKEEGLTVEQRLDLEVQKSSEEGHLLEREGWDVRPDGEMTFRIVYTFQEKLQKKRAEWLFDVGQNTFTPQTELAEKVYGAKK